jgi:hypothetical protein
MKKGNMKDKEKKERNIKTYIYKHKKVKDAKWAGYCGSGVQDFPIRDYKMDRPAD